MQLFQWSSIYLYSFVLKWLWKSMNLMKNDGCVRKQFFHWNWKQLSSTIAKMGTIALCNWIPFPDIYCPIKKLCVIFVVTGALGLVRKPLGNRSNFKLQINEKEIDQYFVYKSKLFGFLMWTTVNFNLSRQNVRSIRGTFWYCRLRFLFLAMD